MCDESITPPLKIIFDTALKSGIYPDKWKRANVVPVHKKESKKYIKKLQTNIITTYLWKNFLKSVFITLFTLIWNLIIYYPNLSLVFVKVILVYLSCWPMKFTLILMLILH